MNFGQAIGSFWKNYVNFKGRARRSEFWYGYLFYGLVTIPIALVTLDMETLTYGPLFYLWSFATFLPLLSVTVRRLHDVNKSGWYYLMGLIPLVGWVFVLIALLKESDQGENRFGTQPA